MKDGGFTVLRIQRCENEEKIRFRDCAHKYIGILNTYIHIFTTHLYLVLALYTPDEWKIQNSTLSFRPPSPSLSFSITLGVSFRYRAEEKNTIICVLSLGIKPTHTHCTHRHTPANIQRKLIFRKHYSFNLLNKPANLTDCLAGEEDEKSTKRATGILYIYTCSHGRMVTSCVSI